MTVLIASALAVGLALIYDGCTARRTPRRSPVMGYLERLAVDSGIRGLSGTALLLMAGSLMVLTLLVVAGLTSSLVVSVSVSLITGAWPIAHARSRGRRRAARVREEWPDALAGLVASIRAGISLPEALSGVEARAGEGLRPGIEAFTATYRATGSFSAALEQMRLTMSDPTADRVVVALALANDVGGTDLVRVLRTLGDFVREDLRVRKEIEARWSWTVTAARVAAAAPWLVLLLMSLRPEAARAYNSSSGVLVIAAGAVATALGYRAMLRAARLPAEPRLDP